MTVVPSVPKTEQCYWEVRAGQVEKSNSVSHVYPHGGLTGFGSAAYEKFFRASCQFVTALRLLADRNWQQ